jgi:hypothetical protein
VRKRTGSPARNRKPKPTPHGVPGAYLAQILALARLAEAQLAAEREDDERDQAVTHVAEDATRASEREETDR